jgi:hypothetical protein
MKTRRVCLYFVATPLHYLAARRVMALHEGGSRNVLLHYLKSVEPVVRPADWDAAAYLPWPRFDPLPGLLGKLRRQRDNLRRVAALIPDGTEEICLHTCTIDTEAVNYHIEHLRRAFPGAKFAVRLLPDGVMNLERHPLKWNKRLAQWVAAARRLAAPELRYHRFSGDRAGSDDAIVERIYTFPGWPHEYEPRKVRPLPLAAAEETGTGTGSSVRRAVVIGQPLIEYRLWSERDSTAATAAIRAWLAQRGIKEICYKAHPKDSRRELWHPDYTELTLQEPLEMHLAAARYDAVVSVCSTSLFLARQLCSERTSVSAFHADRVRFRRRRQREVYFDLYRRLNITLVPSAPFTGGEPA